VIPITVIFFSSISFSFLCRVYDVFTENARASVPRIRFFGELILSNYCQDKNSTSAHLVPHLMLLLGDFNQLPESQLRSYPLVQLVTSPTRGSNILDKISTDVKCWYQSTFDLPHVGSCDHHGVLLQPL